MGFSVDHDGSLILFKFGKSFNEKEFSEFLAVLDKLLDRQQPFCFILDANNIKKAPLKVGVTLVKWMIANKPRIKEEGFLRASAVVMYQSKYLSILKWAFKKQKPVSPNLICTDMKDAVNFVNQYLPDDLPDDQSDE